MGESGAGGITLPSVATVSISSICRTREEEPLAKLLERTLFPVMLQLSYNSHTQGFKGVLQIGLSPVIRAVSTKVIRIVSSSKSNIIIIAARDLVGQVLMKYLEIVVGQEKENIKKIFI